MADVPPPGSIAAVPSTIAGVTTHLFSTTPIELVGPLRLPAQLLHDQSYDGHKSVHDGDAAAKLGLAGAPIEGPTHFSQFEPFGAALWGDRWFTHGCISSHFLNMVIEGEEVQARATLTGPGATMARISAAKGNAMPVLSGTASVGPDHGDTELSVRVAAAAAAPPANLHILDQLSVGQRGATEEVVRMGFDDHMGDLYPFTLRGKLATITESMAYHQPGAETPWGGPVVPLEMLSVMSGSASRGTGFKVRQPSMGLFIDLEVRLLDGPVLVDREYRLAREIVALGASRRTESYWTRTTFLDGDRAVAEVLLHQGVFKQSYAGYPDQPE